jgi:Fe2+ transport system protein FeoA
MKPVCLNQLEKGASGRIVSMDQEQEVCRRLMNLGVLPMKMIRFVKSAPLGDPLEFEIEGKNFSVRKSEACHIKVQLLPNAGARS